MRLFYEPGTPSSRKSACFVPDVTTKNRVEGYTDVWYFSMYFDLDINNWILILNYSNNIDNNTSKKYFSTILEIVIEEKYRMIIKKIA